jgi:hypothetical protein
VKTDGEVVLFRDGGKGPEILARTRPLAGDRVGFPVPGDMRVQEQGASPQAACAAGAEALAEARPLPALAGGRLYLRDDRTLVALDVGPEPAARP